MMLSRRRRRLRAEAGHAGGPAEDAGGHRQRRRWEPRRGRPRAAGRCPAGARRAVPAAPGAQVTGAPVYEMYTRRACAFAARGGGEGISACQQSQREALERTRGENKNEVAKSVVIAIR